MNSFWNSLRMFLWMTLVTGIAYPLLITLAAHITMHRQADGNMITVKDKVIGSRLIAQKFESDKYFWPRPSAVGFNPLPSGGSNLGPTSAALKKTVEERKAALLKGHPGDDAKIPNELLYASGSGLDPHISPVTAYFQIERIVKARGLDSKSGATDVTKLVDQMIEKRYLGFIGEPCVNVLELNLALDELPTAKK